MAQNAVKVFPIYALALAVLSLCSACIDPVSPEFEYKLGLVYIDALISNANGASYVNVSKSAREFGVNTNLFVPAATVTFENKATGSIILLIENNEVYSAPEDFSAKDGETWELRVVLEDGTTYLSAPETISGKVPVSSLDVRYDAQLDLSDNEKPLPGHTILASFVDPESERNYYLWSFRSFERLEFCRLCTLSLLRNGECTPPRQGEIPPAIKPYYTYACEPRCWQIRYNTKIALFSDEFTNGTTVTSLPVGDIYLFTKRDILIELQQFSLSPDAFRYYKTLKDLVDNNSGFNAPLPAALVGNMYNPDDPDEFVLGRFTAAATVVSPIFIVRKDIEENPLEMVILNQPEGEEAVPPPNVYTAPCIEGRFRTGIRPDAWIDQ